jgi:NitT/TauT family transport system permease protein
MANFSEVSMSSSDYRPTRKAWWRRFSFPYSIVTFAVLLLVWQVATEVFAISPIILPAPTAVMVDLVAHWRLLLSGTATTAYEVIFGFVCSVLIGVPLAILLTSSRAIENALYPLVVGAQTIPKVAIAPILLAWFGFGLKPKIVIVILITFFPIVINSVVGLRSLSLQMRHLARSMGATRSQIFWRFQLPNALPNIFAGMKVASTLAIIGAIVAEFVGSDTGLGYQIMLATSDLDIARQFAAITVLTIVGILFVAAIERIERLILPWHISVRAEWPE